MLTEARSLDYLVPASLDKLFPSLDYRWQFLPLGRLNLQAMIREWRQVEEGLRRKITILNDPKLLVPAPEELSLQLSQVQGCIRQLTSIRNEAVSGVPPFPSLRPKDYFHVTDRVVCCVPNDSPLPRLFELDSYRPWRLGWVLGISETEPPCITVSFQKVRLTNHYRKFPDGGYGLWFSNDRPEVTTVREFTYLAAHPVYAEQWIVSSALAYCHRAIYQPPDIKDFLRTLKRGHGRLPQF